MPRLALATAGLLTALVCPAALAERVTVAAGQSMTFNFDLPVVLREPLLPYDGVSILTGVDAAARSADTVASWQVFAGHDGTGPLLFTGSQDLMSKDLFGGYFRHGRFSVRLNVAAGSLSVDPMATSFRNYNREIGVVYSNAVLPFAVTRSP